MEYKIKFNRTYLIIATILFVIEVIIAKYVHDPYVRPYGGDFLVVILLYCLIRSFIDGHKIVTAVCVLLFSFCIETLQYFKIVSVLGLNNSKIARIVIGTSFAWTDLLMYTLGIIVVIVVEHFYNKKC